MEAKKTPSADLTRRVGMFTNLGLAIAVGLTLAAFEYKSYDDSALKDLGDVSDSFDELIDVPITQQPPPPRKPCPRPRPKDVRPALVAHEIPRGHSAKSARPNDANAPKKVNTGRTRPGRVR